MATFTMSAALTLTQSIPQMIGSLKRMTTTVQTGFASGAFLIIRDGSALPTPTSGTLHSNVLKSPALWQGEQTL